MFRILYINTLLKPVFQEDAVEGIRRKEARYQSVMRILKPAQKYVFLDQSLPESFYNAGQPQISVSAIVGENGQGKSSLIELMLRIVNNTAYALRPAFASVNSSHPRYVRGVYAEMCIEYNQQECIIRVQDNIVEFFQNGEGVWMYDYAKRKNEQNGLDFLNLNSTDAQNKVPPISKAREWISELFYTVVVNYSAYSYNTDDYLPENVENIDLDSDEHAESITEEERCWLCGIFHKNDGYQMPMVLNPFRSEGQIDNNNEIDLLQTRIFLLSMVENSPLTTIYKNKVPKSFVFDIVTDYSPTGAHLYTSANVRFQMYYLHYIDDWRNVDGEKLDRLGNRIIRIWNKCVGVNLERVCRSVDEGSKRRTLNYIVYKTIKIALTYKKYKHYQEALKAVEVELTGDTEIEAYIKQLYTDNTHITQKLMRAIAWLLFAHYSTMMTKEMKCEGGVTDSEVPIKKFAKRLDLRLRHSRIYTKQGHGNCLVERYSDLPLHQWTQEDLLPAPSFRADLRFSLLDDNGEPSEKSVTLRSFSSGEKHIAGSLFTALYHIHNLYSLWGDKNTESIKYRYVNLVFDEIELYFHPKYQTTFLKMLIDSINAMSIGDRIEGVNIIISTHSPFVLSDIPRQNILCLQLGAPKPWDSNINPFCANVYDILCSGFFMDKFVGDFAESKYHDLIDRVSECANGDVKKSDIQQIEKEISLIGDEYLRECLWRSFRAATGNYQSLEEERVLLSRRLEEINNQLDGRE